MSITPSTLVPVIVVMILQRSKLLRDGFVRERASFTLFPRGDAAGRGRGLSSLHRALACRPLPAAPLQDGLDLGDEKKEGRMLKLIADLQA